LKIIAGGVLYLIYTYYYEGDRSSGDTFKYFDDASVIYSSLKNSVFDYLQIVTGYHSHDPDLSMYYDKMSFWVKEKNYNLYNDNRTIIRLNAVIYLFSFGYYHVHTVFMCFLSLTGLLAIYKFFFGYVKEYRKLLIFAVFLLPSVLFWSSGVLKEGLVLFAFGFFVFYSWQVIHQGLNFKAVFWILITVLLLLLSKFYVLIAVIPGLVATYVLTKKPKFKAFQVYAVIIVFTLISAIVASKVAPNYDAFKIMQEKQTDFINLARGGVYLVNSETLDTIFVAPEYHSNLVEKGKMRVIKEGTPYSNWSSGILLDTLIHQNKTEYILWGDYGITGSKISIPELKPNIWSFILNSPVAIFNSIFRPHIFEAKGILMLISAFENLLITVFILLPFFFYKNPDRETKKAVLFCLSFTLILATIIGLITPVLGAIVRYKIPFLPFLLIACLCLTDKQKLLNKLPFLKKILN